MTSREYVDFQSLLARFEPRVLDLARSIGDGCSAIEIGGGANPTLTPASCSDASIELTILDISDAELNKAPPSYRKVQGDITSSDFLPMARYDLAFSRMLAEHVIDARTFHRNVRSLLKPGGIAVHLFPTLYTAPFVVNRVVPEVVSTTLVRIFHPGRDLYQHAKFPARYRWCRGPTPRQLRRLASVGFTVEEFVGAFGHNYYTPIPILRGIHAAKTEFLLRHPRPTFTSFGMVTLRRRA